MRSTIKSWIEAVTGYSDQHVIQENGVGPRPSGSPFVTFYLATDDQSEHDETTRELVGDPGAQNIRYTFTSGMQIAFTITVFARNGREVLSSLFRSRSIPQHRSLLSEANIVLYTRSGTVPGPQFGDVFWRHQYSAVFWFRTFESSTYELPRMDEIQLRGVMTTPDGIEHVTDIEAVREPAP